jgi:hypothetical protein
MSPDGPRGKTADTCQPTPALALPVAWGHPQVLAVPTGTESGGRRGHQAGFAPADPWCSSGRYRDGIREQRPRKRRHKENEQTSPHGS